MHVVGELVLDYATYRRIALAPGTAGRWVASALGLVILLCMGGVTATGNGDRASVLLMVLALGFIAGPELAVLLGWQRMRKLSDRPWRYEMTDSTVAIHTSQTSVTVGWDAISRVRARRHAWVYTVAATKRSLAVPRAAFHAEAQHEIDRFNAQWFPSNSPPVRRAGR